MKLTRRKFLAFLGAVSASWFTKGLQAEIPPPRKAIPDPGYRREESSHIHDAFTYRMGPIYGNGRIKFDAINHGFYAGTQWTTREMAQMRLNRHRPLIFNRIKTK